MQLEQEFGDRFVRIHRNCLVARAAITGFERLGGGAVETHWVAVLRGVPEKLAISRRQQHVVRDFAR
jgi:two-component system response regulator AlgR